MQNPVDFALLHDGHPEYVARRQRGSFEQPQIDIELRLFKLPNLLGLLDAPRPAEAGRPPRGSRKVAEPHFLEREPQGLSSVLEIGCATGELIAAVPVLAGGRRVGVDISAANAAPPVGCRLRTSRLSVAARARPAWPAR